MQKLKYTIIILAIILFSGITAIVPRTANARSQTGFSNDIKMETNTDGSIVKVTGTGRLFIGSNTKGVDTLNHNNPWQWQCGISDINVSKDNKYLLSKDGVLYNKKMTELLYYPAFKKGKVFKVPGTVKSIANYAFTDNRYLKKVTLNKGLKKIGSYAFSESNIQTINIPSSVKKIGDNGFNGCMELKNIDNHASLTFISDGLFYNCISLKKLNLGDSVKYIYDMPFYNCPALIYIGENNKYYKTIDGVLYSEDMKELVKYSCGRNGVYKLPDTVLSIDPYAFDNCYNLKSLTLNENITDFPLSFLRGCISLETINFPLALQGLGSLRYFGEEYLYDDELYSLPNLENINIPSGNKYFKIYNGALYSGDYKILWLIPYGRDVLDIHENTEIILNERGANNFEEITIPESNKYFASYKGVLYDKLIETIKIFPGKCKNYEVPAQLKDASALISYIDTSDDTPRRYRYSFKGINNGGRNLESITVEEGNKYFKSENGVLFDYGMTKLYVYPRAKEGEYTVPGSVTDIDIDAFAGAYKLTGITVPSSIKYVDINVAGCTSLREMDFKEGITGIKLYGNAEKTCYKELANKLNVKNIYLPGTLYNIVIDDMNKTATFHAYGNTGFYSWQDRIKSTKSYIKFNGYKYKNIGTAPGKIDFRSAVWKKQHIKLSWKKAVKGADGYLIMQTVYNNNKEAIKRSSIVDSKDIVLKNLKNTKKTFITIKPRKSQKYKFYIAAYKDINGVRVFGNGIHIEFETKNKTSVYDDGVFVF